MVRKGAEVAAEIDPKLDLRLCFDPRQNFLETWMEHDRLMERDASRGQFTNLAIMSFEKTVDLWKERRKLLEIRALNGRHISAEARDIFKSSFVKPKRPIMAKQISTFAFQPPHHVRKDCGEPGSNDVRTVFFLLTPGPSSHRHATIIGDFVSNVIPERAGASTIKI